jgi:hypothetical protein
MPKIKEKTETIITQDQGEKTPNKTTLMGATRTRVTRTPRGKIKTNPKGGTTTTTSEKNCALCGEHGHYTHHSPQISNFK